MSRDAIAAVYLGAEAAQLDQAPEAVSVLVDLRGYPGVRVVDVAPLVARHFHPGMSFGDVLHVEPAEERGMFYAAVEVIHPFSAATVGRPAPAER